MGNDMFLITEPGVLTPWKQWKVESFRSENRGVCVCLSCVLVYGKRGFYDDKDERNWEEKSFHCISLSPHPVSFCLSLSQIWISNALLVCVNVAKAYTNTNTDEQLVNIPTSRMSKVNISLSPSPSLCLYLSLSLYFSVQIKCLNCTDMFCHCTFPKGFIFVMAIIFLTTLKRKLQWQWTTAGRIIK